MWRTRTLRTLAKEDFDSLAENDPPTGFEPNDLHISETTDIHPGVLWRQQVLESA